MATQTEITHKEIVVKKEKIISLVTAGCYLFSIIVGLLLAGGMLGVWIQDGAGEEGFAAGVLAVLAVILGALGILYACIGVPPLVFRLLDMKKPKKIFLFLCLPADLCYVAFNACMLISTAIEGGLAEILTVCVFFLLFLISLMALVLNIITIVARHAQKITVKG